MISAFDHVALPLERVKDMVEFYTNLACQVFDTPAIWEKEAAI